jgi:hypothetical protein
MRIKASVGTFALLVQLGTIAFWSESCLSTNANAPSLDNSKELFVLSVEMDFDSGAANGDAIITHLFPVKSNPL